jgi:PAT family beta-lactamase induction signal transducer AmpG
MSKYFNKRMLINLLQGFSSGVPLLLTGSTLQALLTDNKVDLGTIGLFSLVGLPFSFKFLWAPFLDTYKLPFLGRRRGWMLVTQLSLFFSIFTIGSIDPHSNIKSLIFISFLVNFFGASQDIVLDAYRREYFKDDMQLMGLAASVSSMGYRIAVIITGAVALALADHLSWKIVYFLMSLNMLVGISTTFFCPELPLPSGTPQNLKTAVIEPFRNFFQKDHSYFFILFILLYKVGDSMAGSMTTPFILSLGFTKTEIATIVKIFGVIATVSGGFLGGYLLIRLGLKKSLFIFGIFQMLSTFVFSWLAISGKNYAVLTFTILFENSTAGMGSAAFTAFMAELCDIRFSATQFALLTSLMAIPRVLISASTGFLAQSLGWPAFFLLCGFIAIPGLLVIKKFRLHAL